MIKRITHYAISGVRNLPVKKTAKSCLVGLELSALGHSPGIYPEAKGLLEHEIVAARPKSVDVKKTFNYTNALDSAANFNKATMAMHMKQARIRKQTSAVLRIMEEDANCLAGENKEKLAKQIVGAADNAGVDPLEIACVVKKETHFANLIGKNGVGHMQLTKTAIDDMFIRTQIYDSKLKKIVEKYKTPKALFNAVKDKPELNLIVGAIKFKYHKKHAKGNLERALIEYNASSTSKSYARTVMADIKHYRKVVG